MAASAMQRPLASRSRRFRDHAAASLMVAGGALSVARVYVASDAVSFAWMPALRRHASAAATVAGGSGVRTNGSRTIGPDSCTAH